MPRSFELALNEILSEIDWSNRIVAGLTQQEFEKDRSARYIVERSLEIISEASRRIPQAYKDTQPEIDWRGMASMGNMLRHEYHSTSPAITRAVVIDDLPQLKLAIEAIKAAINA